MNMPDLSHVWAGVAAGRNGCAAGVGMFRGWRLPVEVGCDRGSVVLVVALLLVPLLGIGGLAVDYGRGLHARAVLQEAVDGAAAGAAAFGEELRSGVVTWPQVEAALRRFAIATLAANQFAGTAVWTEWQGPVLWLHARAAPATFFSRVLGWNRLDVRARAQVRLRAVLAGTGPPAPGAAPVTEGAADIHHDGPAPSSGSLPTPDLPGPTDMALPVPGSPAPDTAPPAPEAEVTPSGESPSLLAAPGVPSGPPAPRGGDDWLVAGTDFAYVRDSSGEEYGLNTRTGEVERLGGTPAPDAVSDAYRGSGNSSPAPGDYTGCDEMC